MNRRERRNNNPDILAKREKFQSVPNAYTPNITAKNPGGGGYGVPSIKSKPATGDHVAVNPFVIPKSTGLTVFSQTFPNNYYVEWDLSSWRAACDQAIKMGYPISYSALTSWAYECSPFIQSLFQELEVAISEIPVQLVDVKGNIIEEWNKEICDKKWFKDLFKECIFSKFWGFSGINFDPIGEAIYKYPMQDLDPINRYLRATTYNFFDGMNFKDAANLLFFQPSTSYEAFLGWMQPITRSWIQMNLNSNNWVAAGRRLAFPLLTIGYPQASNEEDKNGNIINPYKLDAENIAANIDPTKGVVYPYTIDGNGNIQKALEISEEGGQGGQGNRHKVYQEFNDDQKNEIRELIFGSTLTSSVGSKGSLALGEIHYKKYQAQILYLTENAVAMLNDPIQGFMGKIPTFYKNFPKGATLQIHKAKQWDLEEIAKLSPVLRANGKQLTSEFFEGMGLTPDDFEDAPVSTAPENPIESVGESKVLSSKLVLATEEEKKKFSFNFPLKPKFASKKKALK